MNVNGAISQPPTAPPSDAKLWETAKKLEAGFLTEMLKYTGIDETSEGFGGGIGESQFTSFLTREHADLMVESGGIGLAEILFQSMSDAQNE